MPSKIAMRTVEIGLLGVPNISMANTLLIPCENKQNTKAKMIPGAIDFEYLKLIDTKGLMHFYKA